MIFLIRNERFQCIFSKQRTRFLFKILIFYLFFTTENTIHLLISYKKHFIHILYKNPNKKKSAYRKIDCIWLNLTRNYSNNSKNQVSVEFIYQCWGISSQNNFNTTMNCIEMNKN